MEAQESAALHVLCTGNLLSMLVDEAYSQSNCRMGMLFGNSTSIVSTKTSDASENVTHTEPAVSMTGYELLGSMGQQQNMISDKQCVGIVQCRSDGVLAPSMRAVAAASRYFCKQGDGSCVNNSSRTNTDAVALFPFLVLVINAPTGLNSWILGLSYALFTVDHNKSVIPIELDIITLSGSNKGGSIVNRASSQQLSSITSPPSSSASPMNVDDDANSSAHNNSPSNFTTTAETGSASGTASGVTGGGDSVYGELLRNRVGASMSPAHALLNQALAQAARDEVGSVVQTELLVNDVLNQISVSSVFFLLFSNEFGGVC